MKHVPHLVLETPWESNSIPLSAEQWHHVAAVLRMGPGDEVTYTDGRGVLGHGALGDESVSRGAEQQVPRTTNVTVVVAPPANKDRQRFLVEKLAELGTRRLLWLHTRHGKNRVASPDKVRSWVVSATEQSRSSWLMDVEPELVHLEDLPSGWVACQPGGQKTSPETDTVVIGPEGGFADDELPGDARLWDLGRNILRVETAAVVSVVKLTC